MKSQELIDIDKTTVTTADFICLKCNYPSYFGQKHCKKCGQKFPTGHGAMYIPFKDWPKD